MTATLPLADLPTPFREALADGPQGFRGRELSGEGSRAAEPCLIQAEIRGADHVLLTTILAGRTPAETRRQFRIEPSAVARRSPWNWNVEPGVLRLTHDQQDVFLYRTAPKSDPDYPPIQARDAYIAPAYTPSGALITGDFSKFHTHHRGFFLAYTHTRVGDLHPDFWNIHNGSGKIHHERLDGVVAGPIVARFSADHRWEARGKGAVLKERWDLAVYDIPGRPYWMIDLTSTQRAVADPLELMPYRYGGMAYRGPEPFVKGILDVLTSEVEGRKQSNEKPARWVDLTGPIAEGSDTYGGALILDDPRNPHHPTVARVHPTTLPFFCFVPAHGRPSATNPQEYVGKSLTIGADTPMVFRYRILIHDDHPDRERNERAWRDYAEPPVARVRVVND